MRRLNAERGAVAVMVAVLFTSLLGAGALVVDVGALRLEQSELQNGADAAALAIAERCQEDDDSATCTAPAATASALVAGNAADGSARLESVVVDPDARTIEVIAASEAADGATAVTQTFAGALGLAEREVRATATASWEPDLWRLSTFFLPITRCTFDRLTDHGDLLGEVVTVHFRHDAECGAVPDGTSAEGQATDSRCQPNSGCHDFLEAILPAEVLLPVFGGSGWGSFQGYATFELTGFRINGGHRFPANGPCNHNHCISGRFTGRAVPGGDQPARCYWTLLCQFPGTFGLVE